MDNSVHAPLCRSCHKHIVMAIVAVSKHITDKVCLGKLPCEEQIHADMVDKGSCHSTGSAVLELCLFHWVCDV